MSRLPETWDLIKDPETGHYAVMGWSNAAAVDVVIRIDYATDRDGTDLRPMIGSTIVRGLDAVRHGSAAGPTRT
ncbi:MAG TPA: hypothetical protein VI076_04685 [Actinopolymorphaceae bacterium]